jgi:Pentapeptide repeats (8 copies)
LALLAGGIAVVGAVYTARTYGLNRRGQITDRFIRGVEQLGDRSLDVRVGGIYALGIVASESRREHRPVMETLAAFVREHSLPLTRANTAGRFPLDLHAAMVVLTGRNREFDDEDFELDLSRSNLSHLRLDAWADLRDLNFTGARLDHAHLRRANLAGAMLSGANLEYARLDGATLVSAEIYAANLKNAELVQADLRWARLSGTNLLGTGLAGTDLRATWFMSYWGADRSEEIVTYDPADMGADGAPDATYIADAIYDDLTHWPNWPASVPFDPDVRRAKKGKTTSLGEP